MNFRFIQIAVYFAVLVGAVIYGVSERKPAQDIIESNPRTAAIEAALYTRSEFFGADAIVPFPTQQARRQLAKVLEQFPGDAEILLKLAEIDERLGRFDDAEQNIKAIKPDNLPALSAFYGRRAMFVQQAETLEKLLENSPPETRADVFSNLITLAKKNDLKKYLAPEFYQKEIARSGDGAFTVLLAFVDQLTEEKNYDDALKILAENKSKLPAFQKSILAKQIAVLNLQGNRSETEKVYREAFDPFWSEEESEAFYGFLRENDRYRAYESELRLKFRQDPADFQTAIRLIHFPCYECEDTTAIVRRLESARAARKIAWQPDELLTVSRFLIEKGDGDTASRFLYTLATDFDVRENKELRRRVLYQLFELLSDAAYSRLALTRGNLDFFETVAKSDARPGITTGILSLIFSDTDPRGRFENKQETAVKLFNRAAAFRVFQEFKKEYPDAPELAQMYLDVVRLYTNSDKLEIAAATLAEFEGKYTDFKDFPDAAMKLADALVSAKRFDKEREIYQKVLDHLGKSDKPKFMPQNFLETNDLTTIKPGFSYTSVQSNAGINVSTARKTGEYDSRPEFRDFLAGDAPPEITYGDVLARFVGSLARENKTREILDLYAAETAKYPQEAQLYEQLLQWLGQTNLVEQQFEVYRRALQNFQNKTWKDRFARWLIRNQRNDEFESFSRSLVATFDDYETQDYLRQFIDGKETSTPASLDNQMFFALYSLAHRRFPHNIVFVKGLLRYYKRNKLETEWRALLAEYYFESTEIREEFLTEISRRGELRALLRSAEDLSAKTEIESLPYRLFRADAARLLSDFEKSVSFYGELDRIYPGNSEFAENYLTITRSFGQTNRERLAESAAFAEKQAQYFPADESFRVRAGEIQAELGDYGRARENWQKIIELGAGENESYLNTATVFWDYFQFDDALRTIESLRAKSNQKHRYAFQAGAILEAKNDLRAAIAEYVNALEDSENDDDRAGAKRRLKQLLRRPTLQKEIFGAFENARKSAGNSFSMTYVFSDLLFQLERQPEAVKLLLRAVETEKSEDNLLEARGFFRELEEPQAVQTTLRRLVETAQNPRDAIAYRLQLAESFRENYETAKASAVIADLVRRFPTNYGVLKESENFYWDLGEREKSVAVLQTARGKARGEYLYRFERKLAQRFNSLNRAPEAEKILVRLQTENPDDEEVFSELADLYVRTNRAQSLRKSLSVALDALGKQELEPLDYRQKVKDLRDNMIAAFTRLKDYDAAAEQYIEIINRDPESEENLDQAISFARRYGGAQKFLEYYRQTARESFKNYRWNVVLARLYEASGDLPNAAGNYKTAIFNQPEMLELYEALGEIYVKMQNYDAALANLEKLLVLSGEDKKYVKQKAQILDKIGKRSEADAERAKLPAEDLPKPQTLSEQFAEAQKLRQTEAEKSIEIFRQAFENLAAKPFDGDFKTADIAGYVQTVHGQDSLESITAKLWALREMLVAEINNPDSVLSGRARLNLKTLDAAFAEALSREIKTVATGGEITALRKDIETRLDSTEKTDESMLSLLENLIFKCGFDDLHEKILIKTAAESESEEKRTANLRALVNFYQNRNDHRRILALLEDDLAERPLEFVKDFARSARVIEETDKELAALQQIFDGQPTDDELTNRFLEAFYAKNRAGLENLVRNPSRHQLQVINFLLAKKESSLATEAINNSTFSDLWKSSRAAETRLKFDYPAADNELYFTNSLRTGTVGEMVGQTPTAPNSPLGSDWFNLSERYGKWLFASGKSENAENYLAAKIENHPQSAGEQFNLGYFYLQRENFPRALEHFGLAAELQPDDRSLFVYIGAAYFKLGEKEKAFETWAKIIADDDSPENAGLYLKTLADFGQTAKARNDLKAFFIEKVKSIEDESNDEAARSLKEFTRELAKTFSNDAEKSAFFLEICRAAPDNSALARQLIEESLIDPKDFAAFYRLMIERAEDFSDYEHDYEFVSLLETSWETNDAELLYDGANDFQLEEPKNERLAVRRKYLEHLLENRDFAASAKLVAEIENSLKGQYPRPVWLRLADFRASLNQNKAAATLAKMLKFTGVEMSPNAQAIVLPNTERLNQALEILRSENRNDLIAELQEAFFARQLALGQITAANLVGLARVEFEKGDTAEALKTLKVMMHSSAAESQAEVDAMPTVARFSNKQNLAVQERFELDNKEVFRTAAEILSEFGLAQEAAAVRENLRAVSPDDALNRIELARLYAGSKSVDDAVKILLEVISDKSAARNFRWQSLLVLAETVGNDAPVWRKITDENQALAQNDSEMSNALTAFSRFQTGQTDAAIQFLEENGFTWQLEFTRAIFEKNAGRDAPALDSLIRLFKFNSEIEEVFGFHAPRADFQIIDLYLKAGKTRAALDMAKNAEILKAAQKLIFNPNREFKLKTLENRRREIEFAETRRVLERLSAAAETTGDYSQAIEFEKAKSAFLSAPPEKEISAARLETLKQKQTEQTAQQADVLVFYEK